MKEEPIKLCLKCGAEYSLSAQSCADCGGELVSPEEYERRYVPLDESEDQVLIREGSAGYLKDLGGHLLRAGIRASIKLHSCEPGTCPSGVRFGLYVAAADEAAAKEIDRVHWLQGAPETASPTHRWMSTRSPWRSGYRSK